MGYFILTLFACANPMDKNLNLPDILDEQVYDTESEGMNGTKAEQKSEDKMETHNTSDDVSIQEHGRIDKVLVERKKLARVNENKKRMPASIIEAMNENNKTVSQKILRNPTSVTKPKGKTKTAGCILGNKSQFRNRIKFLLKHISIDGKCPEFEESLMQNLDPLQEFAEAQVNEIINKANQLVQESGRCTIQVKDIAMAAGIDRK